MRKVITCCMAALLIGGHLGATAEDFLTQPEKLHPDARFGDDMVYFPENIEQRLGQYDSLMVDEPVIFIADESKYKGFKASDLAAISDMLRKSFVKGLTSQPVSHGHFKVVEEPGPSVLYMRMALKDLYVEKEKRGLLSYTPVGIVAHGVSDMASDVVDKTNLVEMIVEVEVLDTEKGEVLFASILDRGHRRDKKAHQKEEQAGWGAPGSVAEKLGRRLACRMDNATLPEGKRVDCIKEIPMPNQ